MIFFWGGTHPGYHWNADVMPSHCRSYEEPFTPLQDGDPMIVINGVFETLLGCPWK